MTITANGKKVEIPGEMSVTKLLEAINVEMPEYVSVQLNDEMLLRANFDTTLVKEGAVVEVLYYMGGGSRGARNIERVSETTSHTPCPPVNVTPTIKANGGGGSRGARKGRQ
jgi:sulfur carrier protein